MSEHLLNKHQNILKTIAIVTAVAFLYATVLAKLGCDWWSDENYSHGLLVPFVIALVVWKEWNDLKSAAAKPSIWPGSVSIMLAFLLLFAGTLGAELFTTRISLVLMLAGILIYLFGTKILNLLAVPFALLLLAIPIPQIIFNRIAFPLQIWASQMAVWGIRLFEVPTLRKGNVIDILPRGATQTISLEVVEACSGIRSLMTLVTLALILAYFTRSGENGGLANFSRPYLCRTILLMIAAVPIAVITNAGRVTATGVFTYYYGKQATESSWHDLSGWLVYVVALGLLIGANYLVRKLFGGTRPNDGADLGPKIQTANREMAVLPLIVAIVVGGILINWFAVRGETEIQHKPLTELPATLGDWRQKGSEIRFDASIESVLRTSDYTMREYNLPDGRIANLYVGYYASQRSGATYHSPQNCLPGAGWVMKNPQYIDITTADDRTFKANRYTIENGIYKEVMIYWYQGRGRTEASEYSDKINTVWDSVTRQRSDGAIVRVMTSVGTDEAAAVKAATDLAARLSEQLSTYVPE
ncbi:MAG: exosortase C-terminal domain/associated protein EpsI [Pyrinomonadaceae bacterium]